MGTEPGDRRSFRGRTNNSNTDNFFSGGGALDTVEMVKEIIERDMKRHKAYTSPEIRDRWGNIIETPRQEDRGEETV